MTPRFSVIIPLYNKEKYILSTIDSVLKQTFTDYEIIIVNDGSTDCSEKIVSTITNKKITLYTTKNSGVSAARNFGIQQAKGTYIALLDGDDYWYPFYLEEINTLIHKYPKEAIFAAAIELQANNVRYAAKYSIPNKEHQTINYFIGSKIKTLLTSSSTVIHHTVFKSTGVFNENIVSGEDTEFWVRIGLQYTIAFSTKISVRYININNSLSNTHTNLNTKCRFDAFEEEEKKDIHLKQFLDLNRFSLAILSKRTGDKKNYNYFVSKLDINNLNWKQQFLLKMNKSMLNNLMFLKNYLKSKALILRIFE